MRLFEREIDGIPRLLVILSTILLLGMGLCGITNSIERAHHWSWLYPGLPHTFLAQTLGYLGFLGFWTIVLSGLGLAILILTLPIFALHRFLSGRPGNEFQSLLRQVDDDDSKRSQIIAEEESDENR